MSKEHLGPVRWCQGKYDHRCGSGCVLTEKYQRKDLVTKQAAKETGDVPVFFKLLNSKQTPDDFLPRCQIFYSSYAKRYLNPLYGIFGHLKFSSIVQNSCVMCLEQPKVFVTFDHKLLALETRASIKPSLWNFLTS